jgi:hypothetical protein
VKLGRMDTPFKEYGDDCRSWRLERQLHLHQRHLPPHRLRHQNNAARFHERRA